MQEEVRGYIFSREFMGERIPQSVQNLLVRDFCKNNQCDNVYQLFLTESA